MSNIIISGSTNPTLARQLARQTKSPLAPTEITKFPDNETYVNIKTDLKGQNVFIVQSCSNPANESLMELLILIDAAKRLQPKKITAIIPFYPYRRQEKKVKSGESVTAELVARLLKAAGANKVIAVELHTEKVEAFFDFPLVHIRTLPLLIEHFGKKIDQARDFIVVAPDHGSADESSTLASALGIPLAVIDKTRISFNTVEIEKLTGEVAGKNVIIIDDEISTGGTLCKVTAALKKHGVKDIYVGVTHGVFADQAIAKISRSPIKEVVITDTIAQIRKCKKIRVLSVVKLIGREIR
ncbi:MAG: ribose-phosphate pyrophosphokinase [Parcubacteria group bacterium]